MRYTWLILLLLVSPVAGQVASFNELMGLGSHSQDAALEVWYPLQDNAASTVVDDISTAGLDATLVSANTADIDDTGPGGWLPSSLHLNGSTHEITTPLTFADFGTAGTIMCRAKPDRNGGTGFREFMWGLYQSGAGVIEWQHFNADNKLYIGHIDLSPSTSYRVSFNATSANYSNAAFQNFTYAWDTLTAPVVIRNGTSLGTGTIPSGMPTSSTNQFLIGHSQTTVSRFDGSLADFVYLSRRLTTAEIDEWEDGPEPINSVAPVVSGTEESGQTLSCTTGTWGLDSPFSAGSNGTITYAYQWTRSNDGSGTGEADIGGATSSTYTLVSGDIGKYIRCRVRASNTGGYDADADTNSNFTGAIASGGDPPSSVVPILHHHKKRQGR